MTAPPLHNRLGHSTSPYLLQHAHNPVAWQPWDAAALEQARLREMPIFLSIGYSACHWCHVMERESFVSPSVAEVLNATFVCIKVDREERPDLDAIYMAATTALNDGRGGWPMSVFLTPEQKPFFAGTYFPPDDAPRMPSFLRVVRHLGAMWQTDRAELLRSAEALTEALREGTAGAPETSSHFETAAAHARAEAELEAQFDPQYGGFGPPPKFPQAQRLAYALERGQMGEAVRRDGLRTLARTSLHAMGRGGLFDQMGGGFARYSTDATWLVPHFEKMLYDNAELGRLYAQAAVALDDPFCAEVAQRTLDFVVRQWRHPQGGFYSSLDADSGGVEGAFYVWTPAQIDAVLEAPHNTYVQQALDITEAGNWEGTSIPNLRQTLAQSAVQLGVSEAVLRQALDEARPKLLAARDQRVKPALDDKILCAWNGMMISALAQASRLLQRNDYRTAATACADFIWTSMRREDGSLCRSFRAGTAGIEATLEDYAHLCEGLIDLYEAGAASHYLLQAADLAQHMLAAFFASDTGIFYTTSRHHEALLWRMHDGHDGATANPHATASLCMARLHGHLDRADFAQAARQSADAYDGSLKRAPWAYAKLLSAKAFVEGATQQVVVCGPRDDPDARDLWEAVSRAYHPHRILAHGVPNAPGLPLLHNKPRVSRAAVYVCEGQTCGPPLYEPQEVMRALG